MARRTPDRGGARVPSTQISTRAPRIKFLDQWVQPGPENYVTPDDSLYIRSWQPFAVSRTVEVQARLLDPDGRVQRISLRQESTIFNAAGGFETRQLSEGFLIGLSVVPVTTPPDERALYSEVGILRGSPSVANIVQVLTAGYVSRSGVLSWPGGRVLSSRQGPGVIRSEVIPATAAGQEMQHIVLVRQRIRLLGMTIGFTASAQAGARRLGFQVLDSAATRVFLANAPDALGVGDGRIVSLRPGSPHERTFEDVTVLGFPAKMVLGPLWQIQSSTTGLRTQDVYGAGNLWYEEWVDES